MLPLAPSFAIPIIDNGSVSINHNPCKTNAELSISRHWRMVHKFGDLTINSQHEGHGHVSAALEESQFLHLWNSPYLLLPSLCGVRLRLRQ